MEKIILSNKISDLIEESQSIISKIPSLNIQSSSEAFLLKEFSESLHKTAYQLNSMRLETIKPLNDNVKFINSKINPTINLLDETSKKINKAIFAWQKKENEKIEAQKRAALLEQAAAVAQNNISVPIPAQQKIEPEKVTKTKKVWRVEIISQIKDVDPEFVTIILDDKKIDEAIKAGKIKIRGLHIFQEEFPVRG